MSCIRCSGFSYVEPYIYMYLKYLHSSSSSWKSYQLFTVKRPIKGMNLNVPHGAIYYVCADLFTFDMEVHNMIFSCINVFFTGFTGILLQTLLPVGLHKCYLAPHSTWATPIYYIYSLRCSNKRLILVWQPMTKIIYY